jgi:CheY-like chemotaxis protein
MPVITPSENQRLAERSTMNPGLVLHIEDQPGDRQLMREAIAEAHVPMELVHASNGADGLGFLAYAATRRLPDLIVVDLNMPKIGGLEFVAAIKADERWKSIPVVVLSSSESPQDREQTLSLGALAFIPKPDEWQRYLDLARNLAAYTSLRDP